MQLKITNNLSSDHALMSRKEIFVPVDSKSKIQSQSIKIVYSNEAKKEYLLVCPPKSENLSETEMVESSEGNESSNLKSESDTSSSYPHMDRVRKQLVIMMCRMFKIEDLVAEAYLSIANWDPHKAILQYRQDENWKEGREV
eukprot:g7853.t1